MKVLSKDDIKKKLVNLSDWKFEDNFIRKEFSLNNFIEAVSFVVKVALISEKEDHHPDITIHSWNKVLITLSTHQVNGITTKDIKLAKQINSITAIN